MHASVVQLVRSDKGNMVQFLLSNCHIHCSPILHEVQIDYLTWKLFYLEASYDCDYSILQINLVVFTYGNTVDSGYSESGYSELSVIVNYIRGPFKGLSPQYKIIWLWWTPVLMSFDYNDHFSRSVHRFHSVLLFIKVVAILIEKRKFAAMFIYFFYIHSCEFHCVIMIWLLDSCFINVQGTIRT